MKPARASEMYTFIAQHNKVSLIDLCEHFSISMSTLRRDIKTLYDDGMIDKQYGTVSIRGHAAAPSAVSQSAVHPYHMRSSINPAEKETVAKIAARFVEDNDVIFIDSGSTTAFMVDHMKHLKHITIVTNNLDVVMRANPYENLDIYVLPGLYKRSNNSFSLLAESYIYDYYNITKAFIACSGLSMAAGVSHTDLSERLIKQCVINRTKNCYLLCDHTKFDYVAPLHLCEMKRFTAICTDTCPSADYVSYCEQNNVSLCYMEGDQIITL